MCLQRPEVGIKYLLQLLSTLLYGFMCVCGGKQLNLVHTPALALTEALELFATVVLGDEYIHS